MATKTQTYIRAIGRRKTSTAIVHMTPKGKGTCTVNGKDIKVYFMTPDLASVAMSSFSAGAVENLYDMTVTVKGGGIHSQAEAVRHAITRALVKETEELRVPLKKAGLLNRDPRAKERRKFGLKKARKAPTWSKR